MAGSGKEACLEQKRLYKVFQRGGVFAKGGTKGFHAHWTAIVDLQQGAKVVSIKRVEPVTVDALEGQGRLQDSCVQGPIVANHGVVSGPS